MEPNPQNSCSAVPGDNLQSCDANSRRGLCDGADAAAAELIAKLIYPVTW